MTSGMDLIKAERERQIRQEGWTDRHDNGHPAGELEAAGEYYIHQGVTPRPWPWKNPPKLKDRRSNYIRGGALLMAEVDRIDRIHIMRPPTCSFDVRNEDRDNMTRLKRRIQWVADRLDGIPTNQEKADALTKAYAEGGYPAFVRAAWTQPTIDDQRSKEIVAIKLAGEAGEVAEIIGKRIRGDIGEHVSDQKLIAELGDVWFYLTLACLQFNVTLPALSAEDYRQNLFETWQPVYIASELMRWLSVIGSLMLGNPHVKIIYGHGFDAYAASRAPIWIGGLLPLNKSQADLETANVKKRTKRILAQGTLRGTGSDR